MDKEKFEKIVKMYFLEEKMKELYIEMMDLADEENKDDIVTIGTGLFKIYNRCTEKLSEMKNLVN